MWERIIYLWKLALNYRFVYWFGLLQLERNNIFKLVEQRKCFLFIYFTHSLLTRWGGATNIYMRHSVTIQKCTLKIIIIIIMVRDFKYSSDELCGEEGVMDNHQLFVLETIILICAEKKLPLTMKKYFKKTLIFASLL